MVLTQPQDLVYGQQHATVAGSLTLIVEPEPEENVSAHSERQLGRSAER